MTSPFFCSLIKYMSDSSEKKWLIRSSNTILGPYTKPEIKDLLKQSVLVVHDEVAAPCTFWRALKDHPEFQDIITFFRSKNPLSHLVTNISGKLTSSFTTSSATKSLTETLEREQETQPLMRETRTQEIPLPQLETAQGASSSFTEKPGAPPRPRQKQEKTEQKAKKTSPVVLWFVGGVVLLGLAGYAALQGNLRRKVEKTKSLSEDIKSAALSAYKSGNYEEAFRNFSAGRKENFLGTEEKLLMISLLLQQNKVVEAEGLLESVPVSERSDTRFLLVQGLFALHEKRFSAAEKLFTEAEISHSKIALLNLSLVKFFEKDYRASLAYVEKLIQSGWNRGVVFYLKALNQTALSPRSPATEKSLTGYLEKTPEYHQELYLLRAYLSARTLKGDKKKTADLVGKVLNRDPYFYRDYHYGSFFAVNLLDWSVLTDYCDQVFKSSPTNSLFNALKGFCLLKVSAGAEGVPFIERAKAQTPEDPVILSLYGFYLLKDELFTPAEEVLELAAERHNQLNLPLPHIMRGYLYENRGEWASAFQSWRKVLSLDSYHITALAGSAVAAFHLNKPKDMAYYRERALALYPHNRRLLILNDRAGTPSPNGKPH